MPTIKALFKLERETKGALRYQQVEQDGRAIAVDSPTDSALIGTLCLFLRWLPAFLRLLDCNRSHYPRWVWVASERGRWYCRACERWIP